ncbi:succinate dehydrogenase, hydrophobic membrane anchor protein [Silicimonas algicola]|uniref:Succinate dehydrogenase hydrophobic membrane anchor subunit n=1 Tax=Silicimonas algicola TaxID=1826607 RepID=A0A316G545_9RHOB|nr:succinate dehydrogenase, hydrophobic membrane anchor protein [Silicimonas algicola]AZQ68950.1 succinate dehydrogenase, hydrophobic membrane anchor protein [Silicimonas algicola]PWK55948.1 succinate dehydrogenase subunit D [Silicimonas algicola]
MSYLTDLKRATGHGSAREGTHRHWTMTKSSVALLLLTPLFVFTFGPMLGRPHLEVIVYFSQPFPAIVAALMIMTGFMHFKNGIQVVIEDYVDQPGREWAIILTTVLSYAAAAAGVFAIAKIAL